MLTDILSLTGNSATATTFTLNSRTGSNTRRLNTTESNEFPTYKMRLDIKHDADPAKRTKPNRRVISLQGDAVSSAAVGVEVAQVHIVFTQPKGVTNSAMTDLYKMLVSLDIEDVELILNGGN